MRLGLLPPTALLQLPSAAPPGASEHLGMVWYAVGLLLFIVAGLVFVLTKRRERIEILADKRVVHTEGQLKATSDDLSKTSAQLAKAQEDLRETETELRVVSGVRIQELMDFWARKGEIEVELENLRSQARTLTGALRLWESGANCHACAHTSQAPTRPERNSP